MIWSAVDINTEAEYENGLQSQPPLLRMHSQSKINIRFIKINLHSVTRCPLLGQQFSVFSLRGRHTAFKVYKLLLHTKRTHFNVMMGERADMQKQHRACWVWNVSPITSCLGHTMLKRWEKKKTQHGASKCWSSNQVVRVEHITHINSIDPSSRVLVFCNSVINRNDSFAFFPLSAGFVHCI